MYYKKNIGLKIASVSLALIVGSVFCFPTPTTAHVINKDVLSIQVDQSSQKDTDVISSNLLAEGGQTILIPDDFSEMVIPITISCSSQKMMRKSDAGTVKAVSGNAEKMTVTLDTEKVLFEEAERTVNLTIQLSEKSDSGTDNENSSGAESTPETEETPGTETVPETTPESETMPESETEEVVPESVESVPETEETTTTPESETDTTPETEETTTTPETEETTTTPESETDTIPETEETIPPPESETEASPETENPENESETLSAEVTFTYGEYILSATIVIVESPESGGSGGDDGATGDATVSGNDGATGDTSVSDNDGATGDTSVSDNDGAIDSSETADVLQFAPSVYHPSVEMKLIGGQEKDCTIGIFPAMTKYTLDDERYLLYAGGNIVLPAGKEIIFDFSLTGLKENLEITTDTDITYTVKYAEVPAISKESFPLIINEEGIKVPFAYTWGTIEPTIKIEHLAVGENGTLWQSSENITVKMENNDVLQFVPDQAEAGTYRATVLWIENEITLYQMEIPFFVQYKSVGQGGTGQ